MGIHNCKNFSQHFFCKKAAKRKIFYRQVQNIHCNFCHISNARKQWLFLPRIFFMNSSSKLLRVNSLRCFKHYHPSKGMSKFLKGNTRSHRKQRRAVTISRQLTGFFEKLVVCSCSWHHHGQFCSTTYLVMASSFTYIPLAP